MVQNNDQGDNRGVESISAAYDQGDKRGTYETQILSIFLFLCVCASAWLLIEGRLASEQGGQFALF